MGCTEGLLRRRTFGTVVISVIGVVPCVSQVADSSDLPKCALMDQGYQNETYVDVGSRRAATASECQQLCVGDPLCSLFTWNVMSHRCWLRPEGMPLIPMPGSVAGPRICTTGTQSTTINTINTINTVATTTFIVPPPPTPSSMNCLLWYGDGCTKIKHRDLCLSARDGRPFHDMEGRLVAGQPCVWCGGAACNVSTASGVADTSLCQPYDWVKDALARPNTFSVAKCEAGKSLPELSLGSPELNPLVEFNRIGHACRGDSITDAGRKNNNYYWVWTANTLRQCMSFCTQKEMCSGIEYNSAHNYCEVWWKKIGWSESTPNLRNYECYRASAPPKWDHPELECLNFTTYRGGCTGIVNKDECLRSRDGRQMIKWNGLRLKGEPCVWCGGGPCTDRNADLCEARDYLLHGQGLVFRSFLAASNYKVASCKSNVDPAPSAHFVSTGLQTYWLSANEATKHLVTDAQFCASCGCIQDDMQVVTLSYIEPIPDGSPFTCNMATTTTSTVPPTATVPAAAVPIPAASVVPQAPSVTTVPGRSPQLTSGTGSAQGNYPEGSPASSREGASAIRTDSHNDKTDPYGTGVSLGEAFTGDHARSWWDYLLLAIPFLPAIVLALACVAVAFRQKFKKKKRPSRSLSMNYSSSDSQEEEELSRLMDDSSPRDVEVEAKPPGPAGQGSERQTRSGVAKEEEPPISFTGRLFRLPPPLRPPFQHQPMPMAPQQAPWSWPAMSLNGWSGQQYDPILQAPAVDGRMQAPPMMSGPVRQTPPGSAIIQAGRPGEPNVFGPPAL